MHRYFIAAIVTATLAVTSLSASPARADGEDIAKALAGIAVLAIIGKAIKDNRDDRHVTRHTHQPKPRPLPPKVSRHYLPGQCLRNVRTDYGTTRMFGRRCLERSYRHVQHLPRACAQRVWTANGVRRGYNPRCLHQAGFRIARN
ncbi:hypothetical protein [Thalassococcus sp. S3]|uniref:hypothetical protein n=1 Tax=Thalassococcus sp. S3 TaxID=2017482 RepID=UPI0010245F7B|nr:hypothetical protein [Thalassococcus sp. S3]QBF33830.1 hypothetical protein CFI11_21820 [Thalassococcus sp. S3]